jgi:hypothetical protein
MKHQKQEQTAPRLLILGRRPEEEADELDTSAGYLCPAYARMMADDLPPYEERSAPLTAGQIHTATTMVHDAFDGAADRDWNSWMRQFQKCQTVGVCGCIDSPGGFELVPNQRESCPCRDFRDLLVAIEQPETSAHALARIAAWRARQEAKREYFDQARQRARMREISRDLQAMGLEPKPVLPVIARGHYQILRTDGSEAVVENRPTLDQLHRDLDCECTESIWIDREHETIMVIDDSGMLRKRPVNAKATAPVKQAYGQDYPYAIHGDVALVNDEDFV